MNEYSITLKVQNNYMLTAMKNMGVNTASELSRLAGVSPSIVGKYLNLKETPFNKHNGECKKDIVKISDYLGVMVCDLFPEDHLYEPLERNTASMEIGKAQIQSLLEIK